MNSNISFDEYLNYLETHPLSGRGIGFADENLHSAATDLRLNYRY